MNGILSRIGIRWQVLGPVVLAAIAIGLVLGVEVWGETRQREVDARNQSASAALASVSIAVRYAVSSASAVAYFVGFRDPAQLPTVETYQAKARAEIAHLPDLPLPPEILAQTTTLLGLHDAWYRSFQSVRDIMEREGFTDEQGLRLEFRTAVRDVETRLEALATSAPDAARPLQIQMLQLRRWEKDYILRDDPAFLDRHAAAAAAFGRALEAARLDPGAKTAIRAGMDTYLARFADFVAEVKRFDPAYAEMRRAGAALGRAADQTIEAVRRYHAEELQAFHDAQDKIFQIELAAGGVVGALVILCGLAVGDGIGRRIVRLAETMSRLADGVTTVEIRQRTAGDEVGGMARAMEIFRQGMLERERLAAENTRREAEAQRARAEAERMVALGNMVAGVAHEVNTPLGIGVTATSALADRLRELEAAYRKGGLTQTDLEDFIAKARSAAQISLENLDRAARLVRSFKQVAVDQHLDETREVAITAYLSDSLLSLRHELKRARHQLVVEGDEEVRLRLVPAHLWQVMSNLVLNANNHAFPGRQGGLIRVSVSRSGENVVIEVADDGVGMTPDVLARCFEPFYTTKREDGGSGLGLSIVHNLVTGTMGGTIAVRSAPDEGTRFTVTLPLDGRLVETAADGGATVG